MENSVFSLIYEYPYYVLLNKVIVTNNFQINVGFLHLG